MLYTAAKEHHQPKKSDNSSEEAARGSRHGVLFWGFPSIHLPAGISFSKQGSKVEKSPQSLGQAKSALGFDIKF